MKEFSGKQQNLSGYPIEQIAEPLKTITFGSITLVVQNGKVVQIDKIEKYRLKDN